MWEGCYVFTISLRPWLLCQLSQLIPSNNTRHWHETPPIHKHVPHLGVNFQKNAQKFDEPELLCVSAQPWSLAGSISSSLVLMCCQSSHSRNPQTAVYPTKLQDPQDKVTNNQWGQDHSRLTQKVECSAYFLLSSTSHELSDKLVISDVAYSSEIQCHQ